MPVHCLLILWSATRPTNKRKNLYLEHQSHWDGSSLSSEIWLNTIHIFGGSLPSLIVGMAGVRHPTASTVEEGGLRTTPHLLLRLPIKVMCFSRYTHYLSEELAVSVTCFHLSLLCHTCIVKVIGMEQPSLVMSGSTPYARRTARLPAWTWGSLGSDTQCLPLWCKRACNIFTQLHLCWRLL